MPTRGDGPLGVYETFESRGPHGCVDVFNSTDPQVGQQLRAAPPKDKAIALYNAKTGKANYLSGAWVGKVSHPRGLPVVCPSVCFFQHLFERHARDQYGAYQMHGGQCPW